MKTILFITPDYVSHFNPLVPVCRIFHDQGYHVVVASGPALKDSIENLGLEHVGLRLGEESNQGLVSGNRLDALRKSLHATRQGWLAALEEQAETRLQSFLWHADDVIETTLKIIAEYRPVFVVAVQLTFAVTAALLAQNIRFVTFVTGHPTQLPASGEIYGHPTTLPTSIPHTDWELNRLGKLCKSVQDDFTTVFNKLVRRISPLASAVPNGLAAVSRELVIFNYPPVLVSERRFDLPERVAFIGASVREVNRDLEAERWLQEIRTDLPTLYFAFGSYFSAHTDILIKIANALVEEPIRVLFASGLTDPIELGVLPEHWYVRRYLPQVALLPYCDVVVCHGGNNTVTEALAAGVPVVVGPFASDQFANATSVEDSQLGAVFDPNHSTAEDILIAIKRALSVRGKAKPLGQQIRSLNGPDMAAQLCKQIFQS